MSRARCSSSMAVSLLAWPFEPTDLLTSLAHALGATAGSRRYRRPTVRVRSTSWVIVPSRVAARDEPASLTFPLGRF